MTSEKAPMRLRPYHPTWILAFIGSGRRECKNGMNEAAERVKADPEMEIELTDRFDDVCELCRERFADAAGSVWGEGYNCTSAQKPDVVRAVAEENERVLARLGLEIGSVVTARELFSMVAERLPDLSDFPECGGPAEQANYRRGIDTLREMWA